MGSFSPLLRLRFSHTNTLDDSAVTGNEGIVAHDVEQSIANLCALACSSMQETDRQIIEIMASKVL
ncbi:hypothetical protein P346_02120 [Enterobacter sp. DC1]|jgi:L-cysteine desulfidase|nr:hypothetical protein P346_02120 [Enterobacter sp. DC1]